MYTLTMLGVLLSVIHAIAAHLQEQPGALQHMLLSVLVLGYVVTPIILLINTLLERVLIKAPGSFWRDAYLLSIARDLHLIRSARGVLAYILWFAAICAAALLAQRLSEYVAPWVGHLAVAVTLGAGVARCVPCPADFATTLEHLERRWGDSPRGAHSRSDARSHDSEDGPDAMPAPVSARRAGLTFAQIAGMAETKSRVRDAVQRVLQGAHQTGTSAVDAPRNGILLHGEPGNGKTIFAEAVAGEFGIPLISVTYADVSSRWIGAEAEALTACFRQAMDSAPCVLFIDEVDSFLVDRASFSGSNTESLRVTNLLLTQCVEVRRHGVVLMAATNFLDRLDAASIREGRFDFKIEVPPPDLDARIGLFTQALHQAAPRVRVDPDLLARLLARWDGFSVKRVQAVAEELGATWGPLGAHELAVSDVLAALRTVQGQGAQPSASAAFESLGLDTDSRTAIEGLCRIMRDPMTYEGLGAALPTGLLLSSSNAASASAIVSRLAPTSGWVVERVNSAELLGSAERLTKAWRQARDRRPAMVFIDSADVLLDPTPMAQAPHFVPALVAILDETRARYKDVMVVLGVSPGHELPAELVAPGRMTEFIRVQAQSQCPFNHLDQVLSAWSIRLEGSRDDLLALIGRDATQADLERLVQVAVNAHVAHEGRRVDVLTVDDLKRAAQRVAW
ncbi:AAA family ATPase [Piscinibacterium candidicorallinum]|uniref:AAA family ATPase n=2 Tax=Piscinibacterium candidicorallinum TaxID=1793872 RepID=A0ABV7H6N7_9BURK